MHIRKVQRDGLQREVNLPGHKVEVVDVRWQAEVRIRAALVSRHHQFAVLNLELNERQTRSLVCLRIGGTEEQHIVLAVALLAVDFGNERRQFLKIGWVGVHEDGTAVVSPVDAHLAVLLHVALTLHEELQLVL